MSVLWRPLTECDWQNGCCMWRMSAAVGSFSLIFQNKSLKLCLKTVPQHVEAIGKGIWLINGAKAGNGTESFQEKQQGFACNISSVILTDNIMTVLETLECFLSQPDQLYAF